ncbi:MAG: hypothetical protein A4E39_01684 [Methanoregulaceae archaeon PtaB.Bin152]|nr:MAG: hypothetical protein A4E39_01684 [Methanoregulaceae archaeon PtaB.Bin152]
MKSEYPTRTIENAMVFTNASAMQAFLSEGAVTNWRKVKMATIRAKRIIVGMTRSPRRNAIPAPAAAIPAKKDSPAALMRNSLSAANLIATMYRRQKSVLKRTSAPWWSRNPKVVLRKYPPGMMAIAAAATSPAFQS